MKPAPRKLALGIVALAAVSFSMAGDRPKEGKRAKASAETPTPIRITDYTFKPIKVVPSPDDGVYVGHFTFINRSSKAVEVFGFDEPEHGKFIPRFVEFQTLVKGSWKKVPVGYCGTGAQVFAMKPLEPCEFIVYLTSLEEQKTPMNARISVGDFRSEPFVLNWKKDRAEGAFAAARKENFETVRTAFAKAGFKPELIKGDDFCERLIRSIVKETASGKDDGFAEFTGKFEITPNIELNGNIRIDFYSSDSEGSPTEYRGWWVLNPNKFTPDWFKKEARKNVQVDSWGDDGIKMELDDGSSYWTSENVLYLSINYVRSQRSPHLPTVEKAKQMFMKMLDGLEPWMNGPAPTELLPK